jgi:hypothetical protein
MLGVVDAFEPGDGLALVHAELAARDKPWLLLLDNITDPQEVSRLLPSAGPGHVLVTTQRADWPRAMHLEVPVLEREVAVEFLLSRTSDSDLSVAGELADVLGLLPLALAQAAAFLHDTGRSMTDYLELFSSERTRLLARTVPGGYGKPLAGAWSAAVTHLSQTSPSAVTLLRLLACCAPDEIPIRLLLARGTFTTRGMADEIGAQIKILTTDGFALDDALIALRNFSLINPPVHDAVSIHRLVQAVTLEALPVPEREAWRQAVARLVEAALPEDPQLPANWPVFALLLGHAQAVLEPWSDGLLNVVRFLGASGNHHAALDTVSSMVAACEGHHGSEHPDTLRTRDHFAQWTGEAGNPVQARDLFAILLPLRERVQGPEHPDTLTTRNHYAWWTGKAGNPAEARDLFAALQPVRERVQGAEHPDTLDTRHGLAWWTGEAGDAAEARDLFAALLPLRERVQGSEHPDTLDTLDDLAQLTGEAGDAAEARDLFAALLPLRERVQGSEHPETLTTRNHLAWWTGKAGSAAGACNLYAALLPVRERVVGPEHPDTLDTHHGLACWTGESGDAARARDLFTKLLPIRERVLGPEHPHTWGTRHNLAWWTGMAGNPAGAREMFAALLPLRERVQGSEHPDTLDTHHSLAWWTGIAGHAGEARDLFAALLPVRQRIQGPAHPDTLANHADLAYWVERAAP